MDLRRWQWRNPWEKHLTCCTLLFINFLFLQHASGGETGYHQAPQNKTPDSNKLDSLSNYLPFDSREESDYKRASSFFPLRGKKPSADDQESMSRYGESDEKRAQFFPLRGKKVPDDLKRASYFMPMRGKKDEEWSEDYDNSDEIANKRASSFMPMRGKKKYAALSDYLTKAGTYFSDVNEVQNSYNNKNQIADKRMQSFMPMRGKRSLNEKEMTDTDIMLIKNFNHSNLNHSISKKSISFMPMRGKRELSESPGRIATGLLIKKNSNNSTYGNFEAEHSEQFDKKPYSSMPPRSRSDFDDRLSNYEKRASSFMPMRGRRTQLRDIVYDSRQPSEMESKLIEEKRASSLMPMRGKRSISEQQINEDDNSKFEKKASSFMPMRGRRLEDKGADIESWPSDQLYSLLDSKASAFMKMKTPVQNEETFTVAPWTADQLMSLLDKKSSSFMPMRGRRYTDEDFTVAPWTPDQLMPLLNKKLSGFMPMRDQRYQEEDFTVAPWTPDQLMPLFEKKSPVKNPMKDQEFYNEDFTVAPWTPDQLMPLLDKKSDYAPSEEEQTNKVTKNNEGNTDVDAEKRSSFMPMRGRRFNIDEANFYNPYPYLMSGMGSSLLSKPFSDKGVEFVSVRSPAARNKKLRINWDSVKRAFHASRGKRFEELNDFVGSLRDNYSNESQSSQDINETDKKIRTKRSLARPGFSINPGRAYLALKRPMSFFATRGKRFDDSAFDQFSKSH